MIAGISNVDERLWSGFCVREPLASVDLDQAAVCRAIENEQAVTPPRSLFSRVIVTRVSEVLRVRVRAFNVDCVAIDEQDPGF